MSKCRDVLESERIVSVVYSVVDLRIREGDRSPVIIGSWSPPKTVCGAF